MRNDSPRVTRRGVQITLGLLWLLNGALKFQPALLTSAFARQVIAPAGQGQPGFISWPVHEAASIIAHSPAAADIVFGLIEAERAMRRQHWNERARHIPKWIFL